MPNCPGGAESSVELNPRLLCYGLVVDPLHISSSIGGPLSSLTALQGQNGDPLSLFFRLSSPGSRQFDIAKVPPPHSFFCFNRDLSGILFCPLECETKWDVTRKDSRPCGAELEGA